MEDKRRVSKQNADTQSVVSWCGSASGEAYVSLASRRRPSCNPGERTRPADKSSKEYRAASLGSQHDSANDHRPAGCVDVERAKRGRSFNNCFHHYRFVVAFLAGTASGFMMFHRYGMTIAVLQMVNQTHLYLEEHPNSTVQDFLDQGNIPGGEFNWNNEIVAIILGWYMFTYTLPQTFMARWNMFIGCRVAVPVSLTIISVSSLLTPTAAYLGWKWVVACRMLNGFGGAGILPAMLTLLEDWLRYDELSSGLTIGTIVFALVVALCPLFSGYLAAIHWSYAFTVPSYATLIFSALWLLLVTNKPQTSRWTSERELDYLCDCNTCQGSKTEPSSKPAADVEAAPPSAVDDADDYKADSWLQIFQVPKFYAYVVIWALYCAGVTGFTFIMPIYMRQFLKIPVSENGFYCAIIQVGYLIACAWPQQLLRVMLKLNLSMTRSRVILQALASSMMALSFCYVGTLHQHQLAMFFVNKCFVAADIIVTGSIMSNFAKSGLSSVAYAMMNTVGNLSLTGVSPLIGWCLDYTGSSRWGWQMIFYGLGGAQLLSFLLFWIFVDSEPIKFKNKQKKPTPGVELK